MSRQQHDLSSMEGFRGKGRNWQYEYSLKEKRRAEKEIDFSDRIPHRRGGKEKGGGSEKSSRQKSPRRKGNEDSDAVTGRITR